MDHLGIAEGSVVADLGAGGGWFTIRLARRVGPNGRVYAQDIQPEMIGAIERRVKLEGLKNVQTVLGTASDPQLPTPVDVVLIVEAYYEMGDPQTLLRNVRKSLRPGGRVGIVESTKNGHGPGPPMEERVDPERVIRDAEAAGLELHSRGNFLRYQYLLEFVAAPTRGAHSAPAPRNPQRVLFARWGGRDRRAQGSPPLEVCQSALTEVGRAQTTEPESGAEPRLE